MTADQSIPDIDLGSDDDAIAEAVGWLDYKREGWHPEELLARGVAIILAEVLRSHPGARK